MRRYAAVGLALALAALSSFPTQAFAQQANAPVRVGGQVPPPQKTKHVNPVYPSIAQAARVEGIVILEMTIGEDGTVRDARILRSVPLLDQAALDAVRQWEFTPTLLNGQPASIIYTATVSFQLQRATAAAASAPGRVSLFVDSASQTVFDIPLERLASLPRWDDPTAGGPPLPSNQAAEIATNWIRQRQPGTTPQLSDITLRSEDSTNGRVWFYVARFSGASPDASRGPLAAVVLLDGTVVEPRGIAR